MRRVSVDSKEVAARSFHSWNRVWRLPEVQRLRRAWSVHHGCRKKGTVVRNVREGKGNRGRAAIGASEGGAHRKTQGTAAEVATPASKFASLGARFARE